ncbi:MAG TPA: primosomal protein N' [Geminicoccaceae bacterium]|nr:primosomal protein N' [Geminicoccaceae bacterium]
MTSPWRQCREHPVARKPEPPPAEHALARSVPVLIPLPLDEPFDYAVPDDLAVAPGDLVEVPFGPRRMVGAVWDARPGAAPEPAIGAARLRPIQRRLDAPPLPPPLRRLVEHVAAVTLAPLGGALKLVLSVPAALEAPAPRLGLALAHGAPAAGRLSAARRRVLAALVDGAPRSAAEIARLAGVGAGVVQAMARAGLLVPAALPEPAAPAPAPEAAAAELSPAQARAAQALRERLAAGHSVALLEGVPGSGKTEVYLEAVAGTLAAGRQALVLLPEIALTSQLLERFARRFGRAPAAWHSELGAAARRRTWRRIAEGREPVVIGARSALFLPFPELGLIVVDEEHDASFKQDDGVAYHGREVALARARLEGCPAVLVSATPALETAWRMGRLAGARADGAAGTALLLPARHGGSAMPEVRLVDLRRDRPPRGAWLAPSLRTALLDTLAAGEQALLFLNRRGFAPLTLCRACGHRLRCPNCSAWLVTHRLRHRLLCHHCGYGRAELDHCPACGTLDALVACGPGVERLAEEARALLPEARLAILTSDSPASPSAAAALLKAMREHRLDLLIGTQIIAKGHHFPALTLVGVVDGDLGLAGGDLRAAERQFQLLYQVAGRAGRAERPGRVLLQTHLPDHPVMQALAAGDKERFYAEELAERRDAGMPPFGQLAALIVSGRDLPAVRRLAALLAREAPADPGLRVLGPAPAPLALLRGRYRQRLLAIATPEVDLPAVLRPWLKSRRLPGDLRLQIDVDPYSFL